MLPMKDGTVSFDQPLQNPARQAAGRFHLLQTRVTVKGKVSEFKVTFGVVDDAARIYLNGNYVPGSDIIGRKAAFKTVDLKSLVKQGDNDVVIVQFDQNRPGNTISHMGIEVNGKEISEAGEATKVSRGKCTKVTRRYLSSLQRQHATNSKTPSKWQRFQPSPTRAGTAAAIRPKDGSVTFVKRSRDQKEYERGGLHLLSDIVRCPRRDWKNSQVEFDFVDE